MKYILLSLVTCTSFTCFGAASAETTAAQSELGGIIKVSKSENSGMQYSIAYKEMHPGKILACLVADNKIEKGKASKLLEELVSLKLTAINSSNDQFAKIKVASSSQHKWTCFFVFEKAYPGSRATKLSEYLYMRILGRKTSHLGRLQQSLYCTLKDPEPTIEFEESSMAQEIWKGASALATDELGFEVDITAMRELVAPPAVTCNIL